MFDRTGREAMGRLGTGSRGRSKAGRRLRIEPLEGRAMMTASLAPIPSVTVEATAGYQVPLNGNGTTDPQTYTVTTDSPTGGVTASVATGQFWSITVNHVSSGPTDPAFTGTMVFQLFQDLDAELHREDREPDQRHGALRQPDGPGPVGDLPQRLRLHGPGLLHLRRQHVPPGRQLSGFPVGPTDYIVQGGSLNGDGTGNVFATPFPDEFVQQLAFTGTGQLAMANSGSNTNDSQFFITTGSPRSLDGQYTIFGQLVSGADILKDMTQVTGTPLSRAAWEPLPPTRSTSAGVALDHQPRRRDPYQRHRLHRDRRDADQRHRHGHRHGRRYDGIADLPGPDHPVRHRQRADDDRACRLNTVSTPITAAYLQAGLVPALGHQPDQRPAQLTPCQGVAVQRASSRSVQKRHGLRQRDRPGDGDPRTRLHRPDQPGGRRPGPDQPAAEAHSASLASPANFSLQNVTVNVSQPVVTGAVRFIPDSTGAGRPGTWSSPPCPAPARRPRTPSTSPRTPAASISRSWSTESSTSIQPATTDARSSIAVYGSKANDRITIDPSLTMPVELNGGTGGKDVLTAGGGPTREQGWHAISTVEKPGRSAQNFLFFGKARKVTRSSWARAREPATSSSPGRPSITQRPVREFGRIPAAARGTFFKFSGDKLVKHLQPASTTKPVFHDQGGFRDQEMIFWARQSADYAQRASKDKSRPGSGGENSTSRPESRTSA